MVGLLLGLPRRPSPPWPSDEQPKATAAFMQLHPDAARGDRPGQLLQKTSLRCEERDN
jgi:hypothetical protein